MMASTTSAVDSIAASRRLRSSQTRATSSSILGMKIEASSALRTSGEIGAPRAAFHPLIHRLAADEEAIRTASQRGHTLGPHQMLDFVDELLSAANAFVVDGDFRSGEILANRAELLVRNRTGRKKFTDEDWIVLAAPTNDEEVAVAATQRQRQQHVKSLRIISFAAKAQNRFEDARLALIDSMEAAGGPDVGTLVNLLGILVSLPQQIDEGLRIAADIVFDLREELRSLLSPQRSPVLVTGNVEDRKRYAERREITAQLLVTALLHQCRLVMDKLLDNDELQYEENARVYADKEQAKEAKNLQAARRSTRNYTITRVTLELSEARRVAEQELNPEDSTHDAVAKALHGWSRWLDSNRLLVDAAITASDTVQDEVDLWRYQVRNARDFAAKHQLLTDGSYPALQQLYGRSAFGYAAPLLLGAAKMRADHHEKLVASGAKHPEPKSLVENKLPEPNEDALLAAYRHITASPERTASYSAAPVRTVPASPNPTGTAANNDLSRTSALSNPMPADRTMILTDVGPRPFLDGSNENNTSAESAPSQQQQQQLTQQQQPQYTRQAEPQSQQQQQGASPLPEPRENMPQSSGNRMGPRDKLATPLTRTEPTITSTSPPRVSSYDHGPYTLEPNAVVAPPPRNTTAAGPVQFQVPLLSGSRSPKRDLTGNGNDSSSPMPQQQTPRKTSQGTALVGPDTQSPSVRRANSER